MEEHKDKLERIYQKLNEEEDTVLKKMECINNS